MQCDWDGGFDGDWSSACTLQTVTASSSAFIRHCLVILLSFFWDLEFFEILILRRLSEQKSEFYRWTFVFVFDPHLYTCFLLIPVLYLCLLMWGGLIVSQIHFTNYFHGIHTQSTFLQNFNKIHYGDNWSKLLFVVVLVFSTSWNLVIARKQNVGMT